MKVHGQHELLGAGAGAYSQLRLHYRVNRGVVRHAHGYVVQVLSDLGWVGLGLSLLAAVAWLCGRDPRASASRAGRRCDCPGTPNASALATLAVVVVVFGVHSAIDWTWYVPGNAVPMLICAGFVASRTTLRERLLRAVEPAAERDPRMRGAAAALVVCSG